jgi:hypothetical protein
VQEIEKLRYEARNARKKQNFAQAAYKAETGLGGKVGGQLIDKLNLPGSNRAVYQPSMYKPMNSEVDVAATERSFTGSGRFPTEKLVSASVDLANPKFAEAFKSKYGTPMMSMGADSFPSQGGNNLDMSMQSAKKLSTPTSVKKSDSEDEEQH